MSERPPHDGHDEPWRDPFDDDPDSDAAPPPATWAGRQGRDSEAQPPAVADDAATPGAEPDRDAGSEPDDEPARDDEPAEEIGAGITDEFALDDEEDAAGAEDEGAGASAPSSEHPDEPEPGDPPASEPPPVEEPPDTGESPPVEEPPAPGKPPSGKAPSEDTVEHEAVKPAAGAPEPAGPAGGGPAQPSAPKPQRQPVTAAAAGAGAAGVAGRPVPAELRDDSSPPRVGLWARFMAASFVIVLSMATATATSALLYLSDIAQGLGELQGVQKGLASVEGGDPQTILILGSDIRPDIEEKGRSDTTMLLRLDADRDVLSLLSLPRDLKVNIPGYGIGKLNDAYLVGGPKKTLQVVKQITDLEINHVVNVDFSGFAEAVNSIECVLVDVDREYFHSNEGLAPDQQYAEIDIDAGYQQLCGLKALQYVRYRHDDNDLVRSARQQSFLREARQKVPPGRLWNDRDKLIKIFTKHTTSDIDDPITMLSVLKLFVELRSAPVRRIDFQGDIGGPDDAYVTASNKQIRSAVAQFLGDKAAPADRSNLGKGKGKGKGKKRGGGGGGGGGGAAAADDASMIDATDAAQRYALEFDGLPFRVLAPTKLTPGSTYHEDSRAYRISTYDGDHYPAYKLVFQVPGAFGGPEYYGAMGTRWDDPPILENPSETRRMGNREYLLFYEGNRLQVVGFKTGNASYWVSNTLNGSLSEAQMLAVGRSMTGF